MNCNVCNFSCSKRGDWNRHLKTKKHLRSHDTLRAMVLDQQEQIKRQQEQINQLSTPIHITIFLEQYKDAMNWEDFIMTLEFFSPNIVPLIVKKLHEIGKYRRPIHCIQQQLCIKQQDKWELNPQKNHSLLNDTAYELKKRHLLQWEQNHPEWYQNETETNEYTSYCETENIQLITNMIDLN